MSSIKDRSDLAALVTPFFDRHLAGRAPADSAIARARAGASWRDAGAASYFVTRPATDLTREDFEFAWSDPDGVMRRLDASGYGAGLTRAALVDLMPLHAELKARQVGAGELSDDIYVMF